MFAVSLGVAGGFVAYAQNPMLGPDSYTLARLGAGEEPSFGGAAASHIIPARSVRMAHADQG